MNRSIIRRTLLAWLVSMPFVAAHAQHGPDTSTLLAAQRDAMAPLDAMNGTWRGPAWTLLPNGEKITIEQTERMGSFLGGSVKVIEGRGHDKDGNITFNALGIVSFNPATRAYNFRAYSQGQVGDFVFKPTADGYTWDIPAGPATIRYLAVIKNGTLREVGDRLVPGREPVRFFEMSLVRVGDTDWPAAGAVPLR